MSDDSDRSWLPWIMAGMVLVVGGAKLDAARPFVARALAVAMPVVPVLIGVKRLEGGKLEVERAASVIGWITILAGEACVVSGFFGLSTVISSARESAREKASTAVPPKMRLWKRLGMGFMTTQA